MGLEKKTRIHKKCNKEVKMLKMDVNIIGLVVGEVLIILRLHR